MYQIIMLYTLKLHNVKHQLYLNKTGGEFKNFKQTSKEHTKSQELQLCLQILNLRSVTIPNEDINLLLILVEGLHG